MDDVPPGIKRGVIPVMSPYFVRHWQSLFNNDFGKCADAFAEAEIQHPHESCHQCNKADNSKGISDKFFFAGPAELFGFSKNFFEISSDAGEKSADFFEKARIGASFESVLTGLANLLSFVQLKIIKRRQ